MAEIPYAEHASVANILSSIKAELKEFIGTRVQLAASELADIKSVVLRALVMSIAGILLLLTGGLWFAFAFTSLIAAAFSDPRIGWLAGFCIIGASLVLIGGAILIFARSGLRGKTLYPRKTLETLKADSQLWNKEAINPHE